MAVIGFASSVLAAEEEITEKQPVVCNNKLDVFF
jgi:hypothetical protein